MCSYVQHVTAGEVEVDLSIWYYAHWENWNFN